MENEDDSEEMRELKALFKQVTDSMRQSERVSLDALKSMRDTVNAVPEMMSYSIGVTAHDYGTKVGTEIAESISKGMDIFTSAMELLADKQRELSELQLKLLKYQAKALMGSAIILGLGFVLLVGLIAGNILQWNTYIHWLPHVKPVIPMAPSPAQ